MYMPSIFRDNFWDSLFDDSNNCGCEVGFSKGYNDLLRTDVKENEHDFELKISAPGIKKEDIKAEVNEGYLTVNVESKNEVNEKDEKSNFIRRERFYGKASRSFYVGDDVKTEDIKAEVNEGYLTVNVESKNEVNEKDEKSNFIRRERFYGKASRSFYVGDDVKTEDIKAKLENGVLTLNIPKVEKVEQKPEPKYISIE